MRNIKGMDVDRRVGGKKLEEVEIGEIIVKVY